ncbi:MAG: ArsR family transcriptional regulator [Pyrobaculum sp.]|uniref:ArsR family transcriptional regulator n=1 Tax=Pyrobaculum sp. TaxID=2004705 RepID=UPI003EEB1916
MGDSSRGLAELIINLLRERGELTSKEIAEILGVKRSSVTAVLALLRREGVVEYLGFCFGGNRCNTKWRLKMN